MVDINPHMPMYEQIVRVIRAEIKEQAYPSGYIGTQQELADRFAVSLITIRKAMEILCKENLIYSKQGKGVFVKKYDLSENLDRLTGITNILQSRNITPAVTVGGIERIPTPEGFGEDVQAKLGPECLLIERKHEVDDAVIAYAKLYLPLRYGSQFSREDYQNHTIYQLYQDKLGVSLGRGTQNIKAAPAEEEQAAVLDVEVGSPLLFIERKSYSAQGELIEVMELFYAYSMYYFHVELNLSAE